MVRFLSTVYTLLVALCLLHSCAGKVVTQEMEDTMRNFIKNMMETMVDSNGMRFMVPGIIRLCFHDCVEKCDGCVDMRRKVQATNNGLEATWKPLREVYFRRFFKFCSLADFLGLACVVATEYSAQRAEEQGLCTRNPFSFENDCQPSMEARWGRHTCEHAQRIKELREIPDADQDPYVWFKENLNFEPRQIVCIMGSHSLGKMRGNETGFEGNFTIHPESLTNDYFKKMLDPTVIWRQNTVENDVDGKSKQRFQWEMGQDHLVRTNSDLMVIYKMKPNRKGRVNCKTPQSEGRMAVCEEQTHLDIVEEMANDNKAFVRCFGDAMTALIHNGYEPGELVATGVEYVEQPPLLTTTTTKPETTTTRQKPVRQPRQRNPSPRKNPRNGANRLRNSFRRTTSSSHINSLLNRNSIFNRLIPNGATLVLTSK